MAADPDLRHRRSHELWRLRWGQREMAWAELPPEHPAHNRLRELFQRADARHDQATSQCSSCQVSRQITAGCCISAAFIAGLDLA